MELTQSLPDARAKLRAILGHLAHIANRPDAAWGFLVAPRQISGMLLPDASRDPTALANDCVDFTLAGLDGLAAAQRATRATPSKMPKPPKPRLRRGAATR